MKVDSSRNALLLVIGALTVVAGPRLARAEAPRLFVLPVRSDSWLDQDDRLLEARISLALTRGHKVRPLGGRDLTTGARRVLPPDLTECLTPACLKTLGQATGAVRVLALELYDDGPAPVLFATLFDPRTGEAADRREFPRTATRTKGWADEVSRWVATAAAGVRPIPPAPPTPRPALPVLSLAVDPDQVGRPEAQALLAQLREQLASHGRIRLALPTATPGEVTHRAVITVENFGISERPHHVHRYRSGVLSSNLSVMETRTGTVVHARRATAQLTTRASHTTDQQTLNALVSEVVSRWMFDLTDEAFEQLLRRTL